MWHFFGLQTTTATLSDRPKEKFSKHWMFLIIHAVTTKEIAEINFGQTGPSGGDEWQCLTNQQESLFRPFKENEFVQMF